MTIGVGLIGHGNAGAHLHGPLIEAASSFSLNAIATSRPESLALRAGRPRAVTVTECVRSTDVDLVVVASPDTLHHRHAALALDHGKHVLVEKPFTSCLDEARDLVARAHRVDRKLVVFQNRRFDADFRAVGRLAQRPSFGPARAMTLAWDRTEAGSSSARQHFRDLASHQIDQLISLKGRPDAAALTLGDRDEGRGGAVDYRLTLTYGAVDHLILGSTLADRPRPSFEVRTRDVRLVTDRADGFDAAIRSGHHPRDPAFWPGLPETLVTLESAGVRRTLRAGAHRWDRFYARLADHLISDARPPVCLDQALEVMALLDLPAN